MKFSPFWRKRTKKSSFHQRGDIMGLKWNKIRRKILFFITNEYKYKNGGIKKSYDFYYHLK